jgi:hypothetical protein
MLGDCLGIGDRVIPKLKLCHQLSGVLYGIKPVIVVIDARRYGSWGKGGDGLGDRLKEVVAIGRLFFGWDEIAVLFGLGSLVWFGEATKK